MRSLSRMRDASLSFFLALFCLWSYSVAWLTENGINYEVQALMAVKGSLKDPNGVLDDWDANSVDPCGWAMVTCSSQGQVINLGIPSQGLHGTLSPDIGNLTHLQSLVLQNNNISGPIPTQLGRLSKLQTLDLSNNLFTGEIPRSLSELKTLHYLRLFNNSLSGPIPLSLGDMSELTFIDLSYNNLSGPVPRFRAKSFSVVGNPQICAIWTEKYCYKATQFPLSSSPNSSDSSHPHRKHEGHVKLALAFGSSLACVCLVISLVTFVSWWKRKQNQQRFHDVNDRNYEEISLGNIRRFQFSELRTATNNFSDKNILGKGGFGIVYKGTLQDGTVVAVKRLRDRQAMGGETQFQTEVEMISLAVHRNLLRLHGFCMTATERLLVYPYMSNGSVASRLKAKPTLSWSIRKRIAVGTARGLLYLHEQCDPKIIHRDVKAANILLDDCFEAVVGDFGLAKRLDHRDSHVSTAVRGTVGHIAPEYLSTGQSSEKTDVFGFGILLLELICGLRAVDFGKGASQKGGLLDWVKKMIEENNLDMLVDKDLNNNYDKIEVEEMTRVAILCTQLLPSQRPKMSEVVRMLDGDGLVEKWDPSQRSESATSKGNNELSSSERYSDLTNDSLFLVQAMELSGPR